MDDFQSHSNIQWHGDVGTVQYGGGDKTMVCLFYNKSVHNPAKSQEQGTPIYQDQVYVRIHPPGERFNIIDRPAKGEDSRRFPQQWAAFMQQKEQTTEGTPIDLLYPEQPSIASMLRASGVHTIEQCAGLSGAAIDSIGMGSQKYVNAAVKYMEYANKGVGAAQLRKELESRDGQIRVLTQQIDQLKSEVNRLSSSNGAGMDLAKIQELIAGAMGRPVMPQAGHGQLPGPAFDAATAQINATHAGAMPKPRGRKRVQP